MLLKPLRSRLPLTTSLSATLPAASIWTSKMPLVPKETLLLTVSVPTPSPGASAPLTVIAEPMFPMPPSVAPESTVYAAPPACVPLTNSAPASTFVVPP